MLLGLLHDFLIYCVKVLPSLAYIYTGTRTTPFTRAPTMPKTEKDELRNTPCVFCDIVAGTEPCSRLYEDSLCIAFMGIRPTNRGELMVIPKEHIDHFSDIPNDLAAHIISVTQDLSRAVRERLNPLRVGLVVHGFGVPHAHMIVVPQHTPTDITSGSFARLDDGKITFSEEHIPLASRAELDQLAAALSGESLLWVRRGRIHTE